MRRTLLLASTFAAALLSATTAGGSMAQTPLLGFTPAGADKERAVESKFDAGLSADEQRQWLKEMSSKANQVGTTAR